MPEEWLADLLVATEDQLLELATGSRPAKPEVVPPDQGDPFQHPDAQRRFRTLSNTEELAKALDYPWERWIVFLHPAQRDWVERDFNGPTKVQGFSWNRQDRGGFAQGRRTSPPERCQPLTSTSLSMSARTSLPGNCV